MSDTKFTERLREMAVALASGEKETVTIPIEAMGRDLYGYDIDDDEMKDKMKNAPAYIRTTMNRVAEIKMAGAISVKKKRVEDPESDYFMMEYFEVRLNREQKKRVFSKSEVAEAKTAERAKFANQILELAPDFSDLEDDQIAIAVKAVAAYKKVIRSLIGNGE